MSEIKTKLIEESKNIDLDVQLDSVFESVELSEDVKEKFSTVFETAVKSRAIKLAESHVDTIIEKAEEFCEERIAEAEQELQERTNDYLGYVTREWLQENKLAVDNGIKARMFDSLIGELKEVFVEHNITVPEDSVDVVAELEEEAQEQQEEINKFMAEAKALRQELAETKRAVAMDKAVSGLTEMQKSRVLELAEGLEFNERFDAKIQSIVAMVSEAEDYDDEDADEEKPKSEKKKKKESDEELDESASGLNFEGENLNEEAEEDPMSAYKAAARRIG